MNIGVNYLCVALLHFLCGLGMLGVSRTDWLLIWAGDGDNGFVRTDATLCSRYRYGTLIVFANYLIEVREGVSGEEKFPEWLRERREITMLLGRRSLD